ncbi:hypothetical protein BH09PSE1_BH09PSE1_23210 [soil metagenome]
MPAEAVPYVIVVVAFFATFIVAVGGASLWTALPKPIGRTRHARQRRRVRPDTSVGPASAHPAR